MPSRSVKTSAVFLILAMVLAAVVLLRPGGAADDKPFNRSHNNHGLIIGIGQYQQWPVLKSPPSDARKLATILIEHYDFKKPNITLLTDQQGDKPTLVNILTAIDTISRKMTEKDNLLIFFSGHSVEDDEGETYWIPSDGKKNIKPSWLKHSDLAEQYFASDKLKVNNLVILCDSYFTTKILKSRPTALSPFDLRYEEKLKEKSHLRSREVIAFGDAHWPGDTSTGDMGLFAYYLTKALKDNALGVIDFENLVFEENVLFPIIRVAGVKLLRGRFRSSQDMEGQFAIARSGPAAVVDIAAAAIFPEKGYPGSVFSFTASTSGSAAEVYVTLGGKRLPLDGDGTTWALNAPIDQVGTLNYTVSALNINGVEGKTASGRIQIIEKHGEVANITALSVTPEGGFAGDPYTFTATTDRPAQNVFLVMGNERYPMKGSGINWHLEKLIDDIGTRRYAAISTNIDGIAGKPLEKNLVLKSGPANVVSIETSPKSGFAGEEFVITVNTDRNAAQVTIEMDGQQYAMKGSGKTWSFRKKVSDIGQTPFSVAALNLDGIASERKTGTLIAKKSPMPIPDIAQVDIRVVPPGMGYPGDKFAITAKTSAPSEKVWIEMDGRRIAMTGNQTQWQYIASAARVGRTPVTISAVNKDAVQGQTWEGALLTVKKPADVVQVVSAEVSPKTGIRGRPFEFMVNTDRPADSVVITMAEGRYTMQGSGTEWRLSRVFDQDGKITATIAAANEDGAFGDGKTLALTVMDQRFQENPDGTLTDLINGKQQPRFIDNNDGTVTDYLTNLMWTKSPKQIAVDWDAANTYCRDLTIDKLGGWRLPTIGEFTQLVDKNQQNPSLPQGNPFNNIITHVGYWTKSRHKFGPKYVYQMSLWYGKANHLSKDANAVVWPVRYADLPN